MHNFDHKHKIKKSFRKRIWDDNIDFLTDSLVKDNVSTT